MITEAQAYEAGWKACMNGVDGRYAQQFVAQLDGRPAKFHDASQYHVSEDIAAASTTSLARPTREDMMNFETHLTGQEIPEEAISAARKGELLAGYSVEQDDDGDWVLVPPENVTIFSVPGEGVLLSASNENDALVEALNYLAGY